MDASKQIPAELRHQIIAALLNLSRSDTLYRDVYLTRARDCLQPEMTAEEYQTFKHEQTQLANLPNQIRNAMGHGDWGKVRELSKQHTLLSNIVAKKHEIHEFAKGIYDNQDILIDPFSPGMSSIPGVASQEPGDIRDEALQLLAELAEADATRGDFYRQRIVAFKALRVTGSPLASEAVSTDELQEEAFEALQEGQFATLERLAASLVKENTSEQGNHPGQAEDDPGREPDDYYGNFSADTLKQAEKLGLEHVHVTSQHREFAPYCHFAWHPTFAQLHGDQSSVQKLPDLPLPAGTPEALASRIQTYAAHPMINSGGVRFLPSMAGEDVLVETFDDPAAGEAMPHSQLLEALDLPQRHSLNRLQIEAALLKRGNTLLHDELGLDPVDFRLICIPPDLHLRIGLERGWGQQRIWTHFDGYMVMMNGTLQALAGGDVRYGGVYDLLGIARNYDADRIIARFAVVQRRRMALWQGSSTFPGGQRL